MKKEIKNVPERIFLVLGDGIFDGSEDFDELSEVTWSKERVYPNDIEFIRKKVRMKIRLAKKIVHHDKDLRPTYHLAYGDKIYVLKKVITRLNRYLRKRKRGKHGKTTL